MGFPRTVHDLDDISKTKKMVALVLTLAVASNITGLDFENAGLEPTSDTIVVTVAV